MLLIPNLLGHIQVGGWVAPQVSLEKIFCCGNSHMEFSFQMQSKLEVFCLYIEQMAAEFSI